MEHSLKIALHEDPWSIIIIIIIVLLIIITPCL
jgi:hypothetical protein